MSMCEKCVKRDVCCDEGKDEEALVHCASYLEERPHGEWKTAYLDHVSFGVRPKVIYCSECQMVVSHKEDFCEYCGADMRVKNELKRVSKELNSEIEKSKSEIENPCKTCTKYITDMCEQVCEKRYEYVMKGGDEK